MYSASARPATHGVDSVASCAAFRAACARARESCAGSSVGTAVLVLVFVALFVSPVAVVMPNTARPAAVAGSHPSSNKFARGRSSGGGT